jgi:hypothetical protein
LFVDIDALPTRLEELLKQSETQTAAQAKALGWFSIQFLRLEHSIDCAIHELLELEPETGHAVTGAIFNVSTRLEILHRLASDLPLKKLHRTVILRAVDAALDLNGYRNWLFHSPWVPSARGWSRYFGIPDDDSGEFIHTKERMQKAGKLWRKLQRKDFKASEITAQADQCSKVQLRLAPVLQRLAQNRIAKKKKNEAVGRRDAKP